MFAPKDPSYVSGNSNRALVFQTVAGLLLDAAEQWPDHPALVVKHQNVRWTYRELVQRVDALARAFLKAGLRKGDRVGIWSPNRAEWVLTQFATARLGLILVSINPAYRMSELDYVLQKVGCRALVLSPQFKSSNYLAMAQQLILQGRGTSRGPASSTLEDLELLVQFGDDNVPGFVRFQDFIRPVDCDLSSSVGNLDPDDPINIQFTSGTTGSPKGAMLSHFNIVNNGYFVGQTMQLTPSDRLCIPVPLYHCFGMVLGVLAAVSHGACMVFPGESFDAYEVLHAISTERCTALHGVPTMFIAQLDHPQFDQFDLSTLRTGIMAGAPCPIAVMRRVIREMKLGQITICYGMTETSPVSFQTAHDDALERRVTTVGRVHPHVEAKIINRDGSIVERNVAGELCVRGYGVMRGYWDDSSKTAEVIDDGGWMHTGDLATLDGDGYCRIVGRIKDMIIRGGENIYPREIEEFLYRHPKILDVAVFGAPDERLGELVCAAIILKKNESCDPMEIKEFCRDQIAHFKIPHHVYFVESFPLTVTGKVQKFKLRELLNR